MKMREVASFLTRKSEGQSAAGVIIAVFVAVLIGAVLLAPVQTSINTAKGIGLSTSTNSTVDNIPLLFGVLLLVVTVGGMLSVIQ